MTTIAEVETQVKRIWRNSFQSELDEELEAHLRQPALAGGRVALETALIKELDDLQRAEPECRGDDSARRRTSARPGAHWTLGHPTYAARLFLAALGGHLQGFHGRRLCPLCGAGGTLSSGRHYAVGLDMAGDQRERYRRCAANGPVHPGRPHAVHRQRQRQCHRRRVGVDTRAAIAGRATPTYARLAGLHRLRSPALWRGRFPEGSAIAPSCASRSRSRSRCWAAPGRPG